MKEFFLKILKKLRSLPVRLFEKYKFWLFHGTTESGDRRHSKGMSRPWAVLVMLLLVTCSLFYIGFFDVLFIPRPAAWQDNYKNLISSWTKKPEVPPSDTEPADDPLKPEPAIDERETVKSLDLYDTLKKKTNSKLKGPESVKTDSELGAEGYYITDRTYSSDRCEVGLLTFDFTFPEKFSYGNMKKRDWVITEYDDGRMSTVEDTEVTVPRPAVSLYMGYIIYNDAGQGLYLMDRGGNILMRYNANYIPAYARTTDGRPLFYSTYSYYADTPVTVEEDESGIESVTETRNVLLTGRKYFALSNSGTYFTEVEYVEERDGRGLNFDFTDSYGITDGDIVRVGIMSPKFSTYLDGTRNLTNFMSWNFFLREDVDKIDLEEIVTAEKEYEALTVEERLELIENEETPADIYKTEELLPYSAAYNYSEGYAVVVTKDTGEEEKYETEEVRVINTYGEMMFPSKKKYYNTDIKDYCSDRYLLPLSKGADSVGHLYFSNGLLRLRKVSYDWYQLDEFGVLRINSDKDVLVYPNGNEFPIPEGYTLRGYSDGILLLERNGLYGYMNTEGKWIADPEYVSAEPFAGGIGVMENKNGNYFAIDTSGNAIIPTGYTYISSRSDGLIAAYSEATGWRIYGIFTK